MQYNVIMEKRKLEEFNEWWLTNTVPSDLLFSYYRKLFPKIIKSVDNRFIIAIVGLRRTGKTTLLYQIINDLIKKRIKSKNILYFSFDETTTELSDVFDIYKEIHDMDFRQEKIYVFLDEIQKLDNWANQVKKYYDLYPKIKFFISGSESLFIQKTFRETLAGRLEEFFISTLSFFEFLEMHGLQTEQMHYETKVKPLFIKYIQKGGFPELIHERQDEKIANYVRSIVIDKITYKDIPKLSGIREPDLLVNLLEILANNPGMLVDYKSLSQQFGKDQRVIKNYILWLEKSFLIKLLGNYRKGKMASLRKTKRAYVSDNAIIFSFRRTIDDTFFGKLVENAVVNSFKIKTFWKNRHEVDGILDNIPVEVKYQETISSGDFKGLREFMTKFNINKAFLVTKNISKTINIKEGKISAIPAWKFLLQTK